MSGKFRDSKLYVVSSIVSKCLSSVFPHLRRLSFCPLPPPDPCVHFSRSDRGPPRRSESAVDGSYLQQIGQEHVKEEKRPIYRGVSIGKVADSNRVPSRGINDPGNDLPLTIGREESTTCQVADQTMRFQDTYIQYTVRETLQASICPLLNSESDPRSVQNSRSLFSSYVTVLCT